MVERSREEDPGEPLEHSRLLGAHNAQHCAEDKKAEKAITLLKIVILFLALGDDMLDSPMARITEAVICYRHYEMTDPNKLRMRRDDIGPGAIGGVEELHCKVNAVQAKLASLRGWQSLLDSIPGLLLAVPVGWAADQYGRKQFVLLALLGVFLQGAWPQFVTWFWQAFDLRAVWFSACSGFMAGGIDTANTLFFVMVSDVASETRRAEVFVQLGALGMAALLVMPPMSAWLMRVCSPWVPALTGTLLKLAAIAVFCHCPETLSRAERERREVNDVISWQGPSKKSWLDKVHQKSSFLLNDWRITALITTFFGQAFLGRNRLLVLQYLSKRYRVSFSDATLLMTARNITMFLLFMFILPCISKLMMYRQLVASAQHKDLYLAQASYVLWTVGWAMLGLAPNEAIAVASMGIAALGQGTTLLARSFLASLLQPHEVARAYSVVSMVEMIGSMFGAPALAAIFNLGLSWGREWIGLPFIVIGLLSAVFTTVMFAVSLRRNEHGRREDT